MIKIFGKLRYHWQPDFVWSIIYWSMTFTPIFISMALLFEKMRVSRVILVLFLIFIILFGAGYHRYFVIEDKVLRIASSNPFNKRFIAIDKIEKLEVSRLNIAIYQKDEEKALVFHMRKWPKKYFVNNLARNPHFNGEVELVDHLIKIDYFEEYYAHIDHSSAS